MRPLIPKLVLFVAGLATLVGCGVAGVPKPPSLGLPEPVADLRAVRKGDTVFLVWTAPSQTTDRLAVRHVGPTRICRSLGVAMSECADAVGEVAAPQLPDARLTKSVTPAPKIQMNYADHLPRALLVENPGTKIFYAISVLNGNGRSAGL